MSEMTEILAELNRLRERVAHLETRQEHPGFAASDVARLSQNNTFAGVQTVPNTGLHILDTNATHDLIVAPGSNLTADRTLTLTTGDADRILSLSGNLTVDGATTITAAAATVLDDATVAAMVNTLGGASSVGSGGLARATSPVFTTDITTPAIKTASGALTVTPAAGSGVSVSTAYTGGSGTQYGGQSITTTTLDADNSNNGIAIGLMGDARLNQAGYNATGTAVRGSQGIGRVTGSSGIVSHVMGVFGNNINSGAGTVTNSYTFYASSAANSGGGVITNNYGLYVSASAVGTNIYGIASAIASAANRWNLYISGTADNYFAGNVGVAVTAPAAKMDIDQSSSTAAIPVLKLEQADASEGFIDYIGTSAASAAGPISTWTVATIAGYVRVEINGVAYWMPYYNAPTA